MAREKPYIYELWNPLTNLPFYVGICKGTYDRPGRHLNECRKNPENVKKYNLGKYQEILSIIESDSKPIIKKVFENSEYLLVQNEERKIIQYYGRRDLETGILTNKTDGGEGIANISESTRQKLSESHSGEKNGFYNKTHSEESKLAMSVWKVEHYSGKNNPFFGKTHTAKSIEKIREASITGLAYRKKRATEVMKGKTWEEIYGIEGAQKRREKKKQKGDM